jgi:GTP-binding protein HflX
VHKVLKEIDVQNVPSLLVLNKVDKVTDHSIISALRAQHDNTVTVSARTREGVDQLRQLVIEKLSGGLLHVVVKTEISNGKVYSFLQDHATIEETVYSEPAVTYKISISRRYLGPLMKLGVEINEPHLPIEAPPIDSMAEPIILDQLAG